MPSLFDLLQLGAVTAANRIFMAPLTRGRATPDHVPTPLMIDYYRQRAGAGLVISEATGITREGLGWPSAPGIWNKEQVEAWKPVTGAVHEAGGRIAVQLWHMGRLSRPDVTGRRSIAPSAIRVPYNDPDRNPYDVPRAATLDDIARIVDEFGAAGRNALAAGFDAVEVHGANGYLIDTFLRDGTNHREDDYGGSPENRIRLLREVTQRLVDEIGHDRVGVRLSPNGETQGTDDSNPAAVFVPAAAMLDGLKIAFLELRELKPVGSFGTSQVPRLSPLIRQVFKGALVLNQEYDLAGAEADLASGLADAIAFGRPFLANPDLPERLRRDAPLNEPDTRTYYTPGPEGYVDYPALAEVAA